MYQSSVILHIEVTRRLSNHEDQIYSKQTLYYFLNIINFDTHKVKLKCLKFIMLPIGNDTDTSGKPYNCGISVNL